MKPLVDINRFLVCVHLKKIRSETSVNQFYYLITTSSPLLSQSKAYQLLCLNLKADTDHPQYLTGSIERADLEIRIQKVKSFPFPLASDLHSGVLLICELNYLVNPESFLMRTKTFWQGEILHLCVHSLSTTTPALPWHLKYTVQFYNQ